MLIGEPEHAIDNIVVSDSIDERVTMLESLLDDSTYSKEGLEARLSTLGDQITALEDEKTTLRNDNAELEVIVESLQETAETLEADVNSLEGEISALRSSLNSWRKYTILALVAGLVIGATAVYAMKRS